MYVLYVSSDMGILVNILIPATLTVDVAGYGLGHPICAAARHGTWMGSGTGKQPRSAGLQTFKYVLLADPGVASQFSQLTQNCLVLESHNRI